MQPARSIVSLTAFGFAAVLLGSDPLAQTVGTGIVEDAGPQAGPFQRIASFPVFENVTVDDETVAEIVTATQDGKTLIYTDSELENLGFIDITDPYDPMPAGVVALGGEPTSVGVKGPYALACVNTSADFVDTSGDLVVVDVETQAIVRTLPLGGQPDSIAISPNGKYAAICIENERNEDLGSGEPPQLPAGFLVIADIAGPVETWDTRTVDLTGLADVFPEDPEPEYVDINRSDFAAVTLQENNHVVIVHLPTGLVINHWSCGTVDLIDVDTNENDLIQQSDSLTAVPREPDAITWISEGTLATADEGDLFGGSRGFTTWSGFGSTLFEAGTDVEDAVTRIGHYPEDRSENKGNEPEAVEFGRYQGRQYLFVGSERSSVVLVYRIFGTQTTGAAAPEFIQVLPTGVAPEGLVAIPKRNLFVVACEDDARDDKIRSTVMIYKRTGQPSYPTIVSADREGAEVPIPWGALSGLAAAPADGEGESETVYTIHDSFYRESRIFTLDVDQAPASLTHELAIVDTNDVLLGELTALKALLPGTEDFDPAARINANGTVNLDLEGIDVDGSGGFWLACEGRGNLVAWVSDPKDRPFEFPNMLVHVDAAGTIQEVVLPPLSLTQNQLRFGYEGVAVVGDILHVAFQRAWQDAGDPSDRARIGRYDTTTGSWSYVHYPLEAPTSPNGGWVGVSELTSLGEGEFLVVERDNQGGPDAAIKHVTRVDLSGAGFLDESQVGTFELVAKTLVSDLLADGAFDGTGGLTPEKIEGLAVLGDDVLIVNDNDGVDDNNGETQLLRLADLFE